MALIPIDAISGKYIVDKYHERWKDVVYKNTGIEFGDKYGHVTGTLLHNLDDNFKSVRLDTVEYNFWKLTLKVTTNKETKEDLFELFIKGNPSKTHFGGNNYRNLEEDEFRKTISDLTKVFCLNINEIKLTAPFEPSFTWVAPKDKQISEESLKDRFITDLHRGFVTMTNSHREYMGIETVSDNFYPKVYMPGVKFNEALNYLRFEKHYKKIYSFARNKNIRTWGELFTVTGIEACYQDLLDTLDSTRIFDPLLRTGPHNPTWMNDIIKNASRPEYWLNDFIASASDKTRKQRLEAYRDLCLTEGEGLHRSLEKSIKEEAAKFTLDKADKFRFVTSSLRGHNSDIINYKELINKKTTTYTDLINSTTDNKLINQTYTQQSTIRTCKCCGKDISHQRKGSVYCSAKYVGEKEAKRCRNKISNQEHRLRKKKKINVTDNPGSKQPRHLLLQRIKQVKDKQKLYRLG